LRNEPIGLTAEGAEGAENCRSFSIKRVSMLAISNNLTLLILRDLCVLYG